MKLIQNTTDNNSKDSVNDIFFLSPHSIFYFHYFHLNWTENDTGWPTSLHLPIRVPNRISPERLHYATICLGKSNDFNVKENTSCAKLFAYTWLYWLVYYKKKKFRLNLSPLYSVHQNAKLLNYRIHAFSVAAIVRKAPDSSDALLQHHHHLATFSRTNVNKPLFSACPRRNYDYGHVTEISYDNSVRGFASYSLTWGDGPRSVIWCNWRGGEDGVRVPLLQ